MHPEPTPAVRRAFSAANRWQRSGASEAMGPVELLLGLLDEPECRAATMLADAGIDASGIRQQWPDIKSAPPHAQGERPWSDEVRTSVNLAQSWLAEYSDTMPLATEHLLLGLLQSENDVALWLTSCGVETAAVETSICELYGHSNAPLEFDDDLEEPPSPEVAAGECDSPNYGVESTSNAATAPSAWEAPCQAAFSDEVFSDDIAVLRILDAAANRAAEALRVVDDYARFVLDDRFLTEQFKQLRHELTAAMSRIDADSLLAARETLRDVGTKISTDTEQQRKDPRAVVTANIHRAQEALRTLEEYGKVIDPALGSNFEALRYRSYTLHRALHTTDRSLARLEAVQLYVLVDGAASEHEFAARAKSLIAAGVDVLQLRDKQLDDRQLLARAKLLRQLTRDTKTLFIINDRADIARLSDADGVHVGQEELSVMDARKIVGPSALIGVSTHSIEQAREAVLDGANYIGVGPTFPSTTKSFEQFTGVELLRAVANEIGLPAFAIGGITAANVDQVLAAGFSRVAVSGAVSAARDPGSAAHELAMKLRASSKS